MALLFVSGPVLVLLIILGIFLYFLPTVIAWNKKNAVGIFLINFFLGVTLVGWLAAFIWAIASPPRTMQWTYTCPKCGFTRSFNQKLKLFACPQCHTETPYS